MTLLALGSRALYSGFTLASPSAFALSLRSLVFPFGLRPSPSDFALGLWPWSSPSTPRPWPRGLSPRLGARAQPLAVRPRLGARPWPSPSGLALALVFRPLAH